MRNGISKSILGEHMIDTIFIALTPFHIKSFNAKYMNSFNQENVLILYESYLETEFGNEIKGRIIPLPGLNFRIYDFFETPITSVNKYRHQIGEIRNFCNRILDKVDFSNAITINIGSDRDITTQVFLNCIYKRYPKKDIRLNAFDEGSGFYDTKKFFDKIKAILFPILSPMMFGEKLYFNKPMGQDIRIDEVFCRFPQYITKNGHSRYTKLDVRENLNRGEYNSNSKKALVFSFPLKDLNISLSSKQKWLFSIFNELDVETFVIKLHPREEKFDMTSIPVEFLSNKFPIQNLNYFDYKYIINFSSSIVMDLLASGYPPDKIITISFGKKFNISHLYEQTYILSTKDLEK